MFDAIIPVKGILNSNPANLYLMNRPDLISTFTKINLWRLSQFRKIVYVDADVVALRAPDELFQLEQHFSASPDVGWPDCFNSGVMVLSPSMGDYYALSALAQRGISFDGADQGLLNMHFKDWNRISFGYNVTPSGNYQYIPAFKHFQSTISMVHFIGSEKPWQKGREATKAGTGPYPEMIARWWAVYDKYYRAPYISDETIENHEDVTDEELERLATVQHYVKGETQAATLMGERSKANPGPMPEELTPSEKQHSPEHVGERISSSQDPDHFAVPMSDWDGTRSAPSKGTKPEASDLPSHIYENSWNNTRDTGPFIAPASYPEPPKDMYYLLPEKREPIKPIFPWESHASQPTRVFYDTDSTASPAPSGAPVDDAQKADQSPSSNDPQQAVVDTPSSPHVRSGSVELQSYARTNAWDDHPEIERYLQRASQGRKAKITVLHGEEAPSGSHDDLGGRRGSTLITEFPTELERPSLPVTPAPRKGHSWDADLEKSGKLPAAAGVPKQEDWDPAAKLEELQRNGNLFQKSFREMDDSKGVSAKETYISATATTADKPP